MRVRGTERFELRFSNFVITGDYAYETVRSNFFPLQNGNCQQTASPSVGIFTVNVLCQRPMGLKELRPVLNKYLVKSAIYNSYLRNTLIRTKCLIGPLNLARSNFYEKIPNQPEFKVSK